MPPRHHSRLTPTRQLLKGLLACTTRTSGASLRQAALPLAGSPEGSSGEGPPPIGGHSHARRSGPGPGAGHLASARSPPVPARPPHRHAQLAATTGARSLGYRRKSRGVGPPAQVHQCGAPASRRPPAAEAGDRPTQLTDPDPAARPVPVAEHAWVSQAISLTLDGRRTFGGLRGLAVPAAECQISVVLAA